MDLDNLYTILVIRSAGFGVMAGITFVAYLMFFFASENGTGKLFGLAMLFVSLMATMVSTTGLAIVTSHEVSPTIIRFLNPFWARESVAIWLANVAIIVLGIYLLRKRHE